MTPTAELHARIDELRLRIDWGRLESLCGEVDSRSDGLAFVPGLLSLLEAHPAFDFGTPGPLVHTVETYFGRGYEGYLVESVRRSPTPHSLWMLRRLANGVDPQAREPYLRLLAGLAADESVSADVREAARFFAR